MNGIRNMHGGDKFIETYSQKTKGEGTIWQTQSQMGG
jgi:hypothetical protein